MGGCCRRGANHTPAKWQGDQGVSGVWCGNEAGSRRRDKLSKLMDLPVVGKLLLAMAKELRHRKVSLFLAGQTARNLPSDLLGLVSVLFLFHLSSAADFRPLQELEYCRDVTFDQ